MVLATIGVKVGTLGILSLIQLLVEIASVPKKERLTLCSLLIIDIVLPNTFI